MPTPPEKLASGLPLQPGWAAGCRKLFNPHSLISHLTNSNGCGNLTPGSVNVSPLDTLLLPQPRVYSQPSDFSGQSCNVSHAVSYSCRLFFSLGALFHARFLCFQQLADSFCKTPGGVGYLDGASAPGACPDPVGAPLPPACPELRGKSRRARYPLPLFLSPRCATLRRKLTHPLSRRSLSPLSTFRINTCKSVSKQKTLTVIFAFTQKGRILQNEVP
jgi:hypothetical protein